MQVMNCRPLCSCKMLAQMSVVDVSLSLGQQVSEVFGSIAACYFVLDSFTYV